MNESRPLSTAAGWAAIIAVIVTIYFGCQAHQDAHPHDGSTPGEITDRPTTGNTSPGVPQGPTFGTETSGRHLGAMLSSCSIDLTFGHELTFQNDTNCAKVVDSSSWGTYDLFYNGPNGNGLLSLDAYWNSGQLAALDATTASYQECANDTRYTGSLSVAEGAALCFTGHGIVAGIKLTGHQSSPADYITLDITVWQGK